VIASATIRRAVALGIGMLTVLGVAATASPAAADGTTALEISSRNLLVHWGTHDDPAQSTATAGLLEGLDHSGYLHGLTSGYGLTDSATYAGGGVIPDAALPSQVDKDTIASTVTAAIADRSLPPATADSNYVVLLPPGVALPDDAQTQQPTCSMHEPFSTGSTRAHIIVLTDYTDTARQCAGPGLTPSEAATVNLSRQFVDTVTDPEADGTTGVYRSGTTTELGDACSQSGPLGNVDGWVVQSWWDNTSGACSVGIAGVGLVADVPAVTNARRVTFLLHDTESGAKQAPFTCTIDGVGASCGTTSPLTVSDLTQGSHTAVVQASGVGTATFTWLVDLTAPVATLRRPTAAISVARAVTVAFTGSDAGGSGVAAYDVRYRFAAWNGGFGRWTQPAAWQGTSRTSVPMHVKPGRTYCFSVRAQDVAGNVQPSWSPSRCTTVPVDDRALALTRGWQRIASRAAFGGTVARGSVAGARLRLVHARADRLALLVHTCPACGRVAIYRGGALWRTVNTRSAKTRNRVLLVQPRFSLRTTTIWLQVVGSRPVYLDGVAVQPL
jgi:hypothetical protein